MSQPKSNSPNDRMNGDDQPYEEVRIPVPWGHISGKWWGSRDDEPILALHGWQDNSGSFDPLAELLCPSVPILSIDLPGHGHSSHMPSGQYYYLFWDGIITLRRIIKYYRWNKVKLLGHSLGGAISFLYAAIFPKEVDFFISLDIASPSVKSPKELVDQTPALIEKFFSYEDLSSNSAPCYSYAEMIRLVEDAYAGSINKKSVEILLKRGAQPGSKPDTYVFTRDPRLKVSILGTVSTDMALEYASRIECPYLNIRATKGISNENNYMQILDTIKKSSRKFSSVVVEGTHHVHLNEPQKVASVINNFLLI